MTENLTASEAATISNNVELGLANWKQSEAAAHELATTGVGLHPIGHMVVMATTAAIPEPGTVVPMGMGALGMLFAAWRGCA